MQGEIITTALTTLLTGFAVVFAVLLMLIGIIKLYGTIIYNIQTKKKAKPPKGKITRESEAPAAPAVIPAAVIETSDETDDDELIAVISAAVYSMYSSSQVRIKSIRKSPARTNAWRAAGLSDNVRPF